MANESPTEQPTAGELPVVTRGARVSAFLGLERNIVVVFRSDVPHGPWRAALEAVHAEGLGTVAPVRPPASGAGGQESDRSRRVR